MKALVLFAVFLLALNALLKQLELAQSVQISTIVASLVRLPYSSRYTAAPTPMGTANRIVMRPSHRLPKSAG